jgi:hypothetical protein
MPPNESWGSALEPYKVKPDRQVFLFDVDETWVARYEYELQDGAPVFTGSASSRAVRARWAMDLMKPALPRPAD